jgi:hypothetical protein
MRMLKARQEPETRSYTAVPLNKVGSTLSEYILLVTPRNTFPRTDRGYTIVVASTFLFTSIVFIVFASVVERRQQIVMQGL